MTTFTSSVALRVLTLCGLSVLFTPSSGVAEDLIPSVLDPLGLELRWTAQGVLNVNRDKVRYLTNDEELIFVQSSAGIVTAFNAENGRKMWASQIGSNDESSEAAVTNKQTLLIVTGVVVNGLDKFSGDELFRFRLPHPPKTTPGMDEASFYVPMNDGSVGAFSMKTLTQLERLGTLPPGVTKPMAWRFVAGEEIIFPPVIGTETIAVASQAGNLHAVNAGGINSGKALYQLLLRSPMSAPLAYVNRSGNESLVAASADNRIFCIEMSKGARMRWVYPMGRPITEPMSVVDDTVFIITNGEGLSALSMVSGLPFMVEGQPWKVPGITSIAAVSATRVYAVDLSRRLVVIDRNTADVLGRISLIDHRIVVRNGSTDRIYVSTPSGNVVCLAEKGSNFATYHNNPDREPILPVVPATAPATEAP